MRRSVTDEEYLCDRFTIDDNGCWEWNGHKNGDGYGLFVRRGKSRYAHRVSYELAVGPIPKGLTIDHLCRVRHCVNPDHLEPVTAKKNVLRSPYTWGGRNAQKTHCVNGHPFDEENTRRNARGRVCRICQRDSGKTSSAKTRRKQGRRDLSKTCKNGHPRTPENTYVYPKSGNRTCKLCLQAKYLKPGGYKDPNRERPSHCPKGHPYDKANTYVTPDGKYRYCRECNRQAARKKAA